MKKYRWRSAVDPRSHGGICLMLGALSVLQIFSCAAESGDGLEEGNLSENKEALRTDRGDLKRPLPLAETDRIVDEVVVDTDLGFVRFVKVLNANDDLELRAFDEGGNEVDAEIAQRSPDSGLRTRVGRALQGELARLASEAGASASLEVEFVMRADVPEPEEPLESIDIDLQQGRLWLDGRESTLDAVEEANLRKSAILSEHRKLRIEARGSVLSELARRERWDLSATTIAKFAEESGPFRIGLPAARVRTLIENAAHEDIVRAIDVPPNVVELDLSSSLAAVGVDPGALQLPASTGSGMGVYMSEPGCPAESFWTTNYDRLSGSTSDHSKNVSGIIRAAAPGAFLYCRTALDLPTSSDLGLTPAIQVMNFSAGAYSSSFGNYDGIWDQFTYDNGILAIAAVGNDGNNDGEISVPSGGLNTLAVGAYDDSTNAISSFSSYVNYDDTQNSKPEVAAPGVDIEAGGHEMTGTSQATPLVVGVAADLLSAFSAMRLRAPYLKARLVRGALDPISGGFGKVGWGGVDFVQSYDNGSGKWRAGNNTSFATFAADDDDPGATNTIDFYFTLSSSDTLARFVLAWLTRGDYTLAHVNDAFPIGIDLDLRVYKPDGSLVGGSYSQYNAIEEFSFNPTVSGNYLVRIACISNRDVASKLHMGLWVGRE